MFKKRQLKGERSAQKRKLQETGEDIESIVENKPSTPAISFKKRVLAPTKTISKEVEHGAAGQDDKSENLKHEPTDLAKNESIIDTKPGKQAGPKPAPANIKTLTLTDFQPDVCKDFLQTGYCGYGDTCKFLHIRDESKQSKPVSKEWQEVIPGQTKRKTELELLPFKCVLCKKDYTSPVKTQCGHIFCRNCFLDRHKKKSACFVCSKETNGIIIPISKMELTRLTGVDSP